jgi:hypothetical protein
LLLFHLSHSLYNDPADCTTINEFEAFQNTHCFHNSGNNGFAFNFPEENFYNNSVCDFAPTSTVNLSQECTPVATYPVTDGVTNAYQWYYGEVCTHALPNVVVVDVVAVLVVFHLLYFSRDIIAVHAITLTIFLYIVPIPPCRFCSPRPPPERPPPDPLPPTSTADTST